MFPLRFAVALLAAAASARATGQQLWSAKLPGDVKWHSLTGLGRLLVGTADSVVCFDPDSGRPVWSRTELKNTSAFNVREVPGTPWLLCHSDEGFAGLTKTTVREIDYLSGNNVWASDALPGEFLAAFPVAEKGVVLAILSGNGPTGKEPGIWLLALGLDDGRTRWTAKLAKAGVIRLHVADNTGRFIKSSDLSGYHDPVVEGDCVYLPYVGCQCVDLKTGAIKWTAEMIQGGSELKRAHAALRIRGNRIYGSAGGSVYALDKATGAVVWKSDRISAYAGLLKARDNALVSQLEFVGDKIFARFGGYFSNGTAVVLREPVGVVALDPATGQAVYHFDKVKESLTNLMVLPQSNTVLFADAANLYGIDASAAQPKESFALPIEFKRKMGAGEVAQLGLGVLGGLRGLGKAAVAQNKARLDVPVAILQRGDRIILQGKQHLLSFDPISRKIAWSAYPEAPSDAFGKAVLFAVTAAVAVQGNALGIQGGVGSDQYQQGVQMTHSALDSYNKEAGKRKAATQSAGAYTFMLTHVEDGGEKGVGLLGISLDSGEPAKKFILNTREPEYRVDESVGRLFFFKGKDSLAAFQL
jgi:outer membrane protein assembly factor BamB